MARRAADERTSTRTDSPRPASHRARPLGPGLLGLQRAAGNRAVSDLLATTVAVQRDVGFELESGEWRTKLLGRPLTANEQGTGNIDHGASPIALPPGRSAFVAQPGFRGTADEIPEGRDLEFVIDHVPEDRADLINAAFDRVAAALAAMEARERLQAAQRSYFWPERHLGWAPPTPGTWLLENTGRAAPTRFVVQATAGLRLDRMHGLMVNMGERPANAADDPAAQTSMDPGAGGELWGAARMARASWHEHLAAQPDPGGVFADDAAVLGFLSQLTVPLEGGTRAIPEREVANISYPKALAHLMARTDFAALFRLLPLAQQQGLRAGRLLDVVGRIAGRTDVPGLDVRLLQQNVWTQIERTQILLTRRAWIEGILANTDRLTEAGYRAWLDAQVAQPRGMHAATYERAVAGARHLDALGSRGAAVDQRDGRQLPLFEFRAMTSDGQRSMALPEARQRALRLAAYVHRVNRGTAQLPVE